jgi:NADH:ubiquinone oxidoreductase subunit 6 (subunit J)
MQGTIDWYAVFFWLFASLSCLFALAVLFSNDIVRMAFYLILSLGAVSGLFFLAGAEFAGAMQLMIYVGGTLVLLVFGVMLTAKSRYIRLKGGGGEWIFTLIIGSSLLLLLLRTAFMVDRWREPLHTSVAAAIPEQPSTTPIGLALTGIRLDGTGVGTDGRSGYLLPFMIVSVHLLVVLVGAAYVARAKRRVNGT